MRLFYHLGDITVNNAWLLQKRIHESKGFKYKSSLADFREELAVSLCKVRKLVSLKRGRPTGDKQGNDLTKKKQRNTHKTPPDVRYDGVQHKPDWTEKIQKCKY